jgi:glycosyltransferase involved in cell wall biosynthesis
VSRRLRIALFSGNYNYLREGASQALNRLVAYLEDAGHAVRIYSPVTGTPAFEPAGTLIAVPSIALPFRNEFRLALGLPRAIGKDIARFGPDVIHVSTPDLLGMRAQSWASRRQVPVVASLHTRFEAYLSHYGLDWLRPIVEAHLRRFYRRADWVLAPTPALVEDLKRLRGDGRAALWSRGVDLSLFSPERRDPAWRRAHGWADDDVVVLFLGRLVVEKGVDTYLEAVRLLQDRGCNVRPLIVGAGPAAHRLRSLKDAVFTGHLQGGELTRAIASADIMIHPSTTEAFGNVVLECMACAVPVVGADVPSARALIDDGRTGVLCSPTADEIAAAVMRLFQSPGERRRIGAAAREASEAYRWDAASAAVERAYLEVVGD